MAQTFEGYVSQLSQLSGHGLLDGNSAYGVGKLAFSHANLKDFAQASGFTNKDDAALAVIERIEPGSKLDERDPMRYAHGADYQFTYPYPKTYSGALQLAKMPWDYSRDASLWGLLAVISLVI